MENTITTPKKPQPGTSIRIDSGHYHYRPLDTDRVYEILEFFRLGYGTKTHWNVRLVGDNDWFDAGNTLEEAKIIADSDAFYWNP
jgi:hypothetical protein